MRYDSEIGAQRTHVLFMIHKQILYKMAEEGSKKIDENNIEEGGENKNKTDESTSASQDESAAGKGNSKSPSKSKTDDAQGTKSKKKEEKPEDDDESSDDEELVGSLDAPLVVEGKRVRKSTEFLSNTISPSVVEKRKFEIPQGKGETLGSMARVQFQIQKIPGEELKPLHRILFGRDGKASEVKKNIRLFNGFDIEKGSKEYKKKEDQVERFTSDSMKRLCEILDVEKKGNKEEVLERVMDFLLCPKSSGKPAPEAKKKGSSSTSSSKKRKQPTPKTDKSKSKKVKSDETVESGKDSEEEDVEKKLKPSAKKPKSPKKEGKESKKPAKKDKKVVSIKISPGKKTKKAKAKKEDSDDSSDEEPLSKKAKKSPPSNDEIVKLVKELLDGADLEKITMKGVCKKVYDRFPDFDLSDRKEFIKNAVKEIIT